MQTKDAVLVEVKYRDRGLCRIYYTPVNKKDKRIFCLTDDGEWFICSKDGEPSHQPDYELLVLVQG